MKYFLNNHAIVRFEDIILNKLGSDIAVKVRYSNKSKHLGIRVISNNVELVLPTTYSINNGRKFLLSKEAWVRAKLKQQIYEIDKLQNEAHIDHDILPFFGKTFKLLHIISDKKGSEVIVHDNDIIEIHSTNLTKHKVLITFLQDKLLSYVTPKIELLSAKHDFYWTAIKITEAKSKWGSCSSKAVITFNWRLVFAPYEMIDYVIAHELCHTIEMNHSKNFWRLVKRIYPDFKRAKLWFKNNSLKLHSYLK